MFSRLLQFSSVALLLTGCSSVKKFTRVGDSQYCLIDYKKKTIECNFNSMKECTEQYHNYDQAHCFRKKDLTSQKINELERKQ
jgi:hypothetical protein